ncbi:Protein of unknown function (DUF1780) (plasmid) [Desulfocapsa sulfexigens DSM 10523]|uniref:Uncharacterized protein n=1 Tax=Desulfocapsa sulfexigens (strain DSM 10523 / SB164P1) TaxID=1167006 RepID=M1P9G0_DESSD|nr:DUF1780 domain-containing protein [Desulfocapsa sulfexigens]AGF80088.1 Protein of unknown function (DUF1780) [Desulfocapsa sulfexigens DSM 10523]
MEEHEILQNIKDAAQDALYFYSNRGKEERERWVVKELLKFLGIPHENSEIISHEQNSKTDVEFRKCSFQIKEIPDPCILRSKYYKDQYNAIKSARKLEDIELPATVAQDTPEITRMYDLVLLESQKLSESDVYLTTKNELDLVFYVTRTRASLVSNEEINAKDFVNLGWRSISCLNAKQAVVLFASKKAPAFFKTNERQIFG